MKKFFLALCVITITAQAAEEMQFTQKEWEIYCDNTRTCRAAGYTSDDAESPASILLTRLAGQGQRITADVRRANPDNEKLPIAGMLHIGGQYAGPLYFDEEDRARLTPHQTQSVLKAITGKSAVEVISGDQASVISSEGANAVLLKMEEVQGRLGTTSAVIKRGTGTDVLQALPMPVIHKQPLFSTHVLDWNHKLNKAALRKALIDRSGNDCDFDDPSFKFSPKVEAQLTRDTLLVSAICTHGAYNFNLVFWTINTQPPYQPEEIMQDASFLDEQGDIVAQFLDRGVGDCVSRRRWVWTGASFVLSTEYDSGMCKLIRGGGTWELPTYVSQVQ